MDLLKPNWGVQRQINTIKRLHAMMRIVLLIVLYVLGLILINESVAAEKVADSRINCDIHAGACSQHMQDSQITLDISPKPVKAMQDLLFKVTITGQKPQMAPYIDLGMPGMKMGPNQIKLERISGDVYTGRGVIVRCPSGRRIWQAIVTVPGKGKADFIFDVVY